jgi:hypothetical protein
MAVYLQLKSRFECPKLHFEVLGIPRLVSKAGIVDCKRKKAH